MPETKVNAEKLLDVSFADKQYNQSLKSYKYVLDKYKISLDLALKLDKQFSIFLDTNVLLSIYEVSFIAREKLKQFVKDHSAEILITAQIQHEYIKNREKVIKNFQATVTEQIPKSFKNDVINKLISFKNNNKSKLEDYVEVQKKLDYLERSANRLNNVILEKVNDKKDSADSLLFDDDFLKILSKLNTTQAFSDSQISKLKKDYDNLLSVYNNNSKRNQGDGIEIKENFSLTVFPGCGEKSEKDDPTGDFIIFHELMDYAKNKNKDIIFLTNDTKKGDWLRKDGSTHIHYLENFYQNTNQMIYILNAERLFENIFSDVSFQSLIPLTITKNSVNDFDESTIVSFLNSYEPFRRFRTIRKFPTYYIDELKRNGYTNISDLKIALDNTLPITEMIYKAYSHYSKIGALRDSLRITSDIYFANDGNGFVEYELYEEDIPIKDYWDHLKKSDGQAET